MFTLIGMNALGLPAAMLAVEAFRGEDGRVTFRAPKSRTRKVAPATTILVAGDHRDAVRAATWEETAPGCTRSRFHAFSPEWERVIAELAARLPEVTAGEMRESRRKSNANARARGRADALRSIGLTRTRSGAWE